MRIGEVADAVGLSTKTLRFYEQSGLLPAPARSANGYRDYQPEILPGWNSLPAVAQQG